MRNTKSTTWPTASPKRKGALSRYRTKSTNVRSQIAASPIRALNTSTATSSIVCAVLAPSLFIRRRGGRDTDRLLPDTPKQIYHCDYPGCDRHFVRADLCARHKERHTAKGSHLQRKDAFMNSQRAATNTNGSHSPNGHTANSASLSDAPQPHAPTQQRDSFSQPNGQAAHQSYASSEQFTGQNAHEPPPMASANGVQLDPQLSAGGSYHPYQPGYSGQPAMLPPTTSSTVQRRYSQDTNFQRPASVATAYAHQQLPGSMYPPPPLSSSQSTASMYVQPPYPSPTSNGTQSRSQTTPNGSMSSVPPFGMPSGYNGHGSNHGRMPNVMSPLAMNGMEQYQVPNSRPNSIVDFNVIDQYAAGYAMPVFGLGAEGLNRSPPLAIMDDYVFNQLLENGGLDINPPTPPLPDPPYHSYMQNAPMPKVEPEGSTSELSTSAEPWDTSSPPISGFDINMRESLITEKKQQRLINMIKEFEDVDRLPGRKTKAEILAGDHNDPTHSLSIQMLRTSITSYWVHIHQQMPILHRPTFSAETCPDLLLLAMMCLGACCLERIHDAETVYHCSELSFYTAYHIRWEVFKDAEFRPTAKLWTFQTMLLLELFEKMYSTRELHERAHIHHATTLTVMRRGSSLIGRSAIDSSADHDDPTRTPPGPDGSINTSGQNTPDASWNRWITAEATRRVAFAAFVIDSTHATLFGHAAVMSPHDIRLPLPCDEALWSATSSAEVQRVEASLAANGFKPSSFLDGLKKTLHGQRVRTNTFGRMILMAGLLNVSWHMNQRDLQVSSLGAASTLGNQTRWRSPLTRAFDFWRRDFDDSLSKNDYWLQASNPSTKDRTTVDHRDNVIESRTCLHSLAHMAMHVDIVDCEVFAGAERALGRVVTDGDRAAVQRRMREQWAPSARARDATFYALRFLHETLITHDPTPAPQGAVEPQGAFKYSARDDYLLNRPWILYFACMIVWAYGYALDGPLKPSANYNLHVLASPAQRVGDLQRFLERMARATSPEDLQSVTDRNACLGLLLLLKEIFQQPRWQLLHEAGEMLGLCLDALVPGQSPDAKARMG